MKLNIRAGLVGSATLGVALLAGTGVAMAATADGSGIVDSFSINNPTGSGPGGLIFYGPDKTTPITSGSTTLPLASVIGEVQAVGTIPGYAGDDATATKYTAGVSVEKPNGTDPTAWGGTPLSAPATVANPTAAPIWSPKVAALPLSQALVQADGTGADGFYEIRFIVSDNGSNPGGTSPTYYTADISVSNGTFTVVDPVAPPASTNLPEVPMSALLPLAGFATAAGVVVVRRRRKVASTI